MNNKGFTLPEVLVAIVLISIVSIFVASEIGSTLSATKTESYSIMKQNILAASETYIKECENKIIECNLTWENNITTFKATNLKESGYYTNFKSPIDNKELDECLIIKIIRNNGVIQSSMIDNCY